MDTGYQELVFEDAMEVIIDQLNALGTQDPLTVQSLEGNMRDGMISNMVVMFLRMLTSCEVQRREDFFAPFIMVRMACLGNAFLAILSLVTGCSHASCVRKRACPNTDFLSCCMQDVLDACLIHAHAWSMWYFVSRHLIVN